MNLLRTMVAYGGGTNSVAMLVGMAQHNEPPPDLILFADTGGEKPHTYNHLQPMNRWLLARGWPSITLVRLVKPKGWESLEEQCRRLKVLPPIAYGWKTCSQRYKIEPQDRFVSEWARPGEILVKCIGYDLDEKRRWQNKPAQQGRYLLRYPLVEWGWSREDCLKAILDAGLPLPGKSACFFCPSSRKAEVTELRERYPDLYARAINMERDAREGTGKGGSTGFKTVKGLGRHFSWEALNDGPDAPPDLDCGCYDGDPD